MSEWCKEQVYHSDSFGTSQCSRRAVRDGYCKTHHPEVVAARRATRSAKIDADLTARLRRGAVDHARVAVAKTCCAWLDYCADVFEWNNDTRARADELWREMVRARRDLRALEREATDG